MSEEKKTRKLNIVSDGTPKGTKLFTESGEEIGGVTSIKWEIGLDRIATCMITFNNVEAAVDVGEFDTLIDTTALGQGVRTFENFSDKKEPSAN